MQKPYIPDFNFEKLHQDIQEKLEHKILEERKPEGDSENKLVVNGKEGEGEAERVADEKEEGAGIEISPNKNDDNQDIMKDTIKRRRLLSVENGQSQTFSEKSKSNAKRSAAIFDNEVKNSKDIPIGKWRIPNLGQDLLLRMKISDGKGITKEEKLAIIRGREDYEKGASKTMDRLEPLNQEMVNINEKYSKENSFLPWERSNLFANKSDHSEENRLDDYQHLRHRSRKLLDTYGNSLRYVNKLYNKKFGFVARKVPAHMVHMVDVNVMNELQNDILSDREIRTLATRLYELPLDLQTLSGLEKTIINCSKFFKEEIVVADPEKLEEYYVKEMPQVSKALMLNCGPVIKKMEASVEGMRLWVRRRLPLKMIRTNVSHVIGQLDDVRKNPKKFVCLNDNINHNAEGAKMVKAVLQDYYEAMFPIPSQFELPREYRNRFLHIDELSECAMMKPSLHPHPPPPLFHPYSTPPPPHSTPTPPLLHPLPPLLHPSSTPPPPLFHPSSTPLPPLLHPSSTPTPPLLHPYSTPPPPLLHLYSTPTPPLLHPPPPLLHPSSTPPPPLYCSAGEFIVIGYVFGPIYLLVHWFCLVLLHSALTSWSVARGDAAAGGEGEFAEIYQRGSSMYDGGDGNHNGIVLILLEEEFCTYFQCADFAQWLSFVCVQGCVVKKRCPCGLRL
ncbi:hypothetical protein BSL78_18434 [Apostichopus japonicus]|uniref:Stealth protein CR4 conserved region 4 domain-containing protein n=1 Tax=Stichopus japonicus TaxID=307972 RepID=A0A2G8K9P9_STIJA|nr:hypothetical protein BSL78_18434 [Apostichopus japonicus]